MHINNVQSISNYIYTKYTSTHRYSSWKAFGDDDTSSMILVHPKSAEHA